MGRSAHSLSKGKPSEGYQGIWCSWKGGRTKASPLYPVLNTSSLLEATDSCNFREHTYFQGHQMISF